MAEWSHYKDIEYSMVFKRQGYSIGHYLVMLQIPTEDRIFKKNYNIDIEDADFAKELKNLIDGKTKRIYLAYGMQDIDIFKTNETYAITHSPHEGSNIQLVLKKGELEKLYQDLFAETKMPHN